MGFFSGWAGYATAYSAGNFQEPSDATYLRRPMEFSRASGIFTVSQTGGTVGPASVDWGHLVYLGLFTQSSGGMPLLVVPLARPINIRAGSTYSEAATAYTLRLMSGPQDLSGLWPAGAVVAQTQHGGACVTGTSVQFVDGQIGEMAMSMNQSTNTSALPIAPGPAGSLWLNGGLLSVA